MSASRRIDACRSVLLRSAQAKRHARAFSSSASNGGVLPVDAADNDTPSAATSTPAPSPLFVPLAPPNDANESDDAHAKHANAYFAAAADVARKLRAAGYPAVVAGGWVRDRLLREGAAAAAAARGKGGEQATEERRPPPPPPSADVDLATAAPLHEVKRLFGHGATDLPRGTVRLHHMGHAIEVARLGAGPAGQFFEASWLGGGGRDDDAPVGAAAGLPPPPPPAPLPLPSSSSDLLPLDAMRYSAAHRDFTINALFYDPHSARVVDFVGGVADARRRVLRLVDCGGGQAGGGGGGQCGNGWRRLAEDPLRCLRGVRFAAQLGLALDPDTAAAIRDHGELCGPGRGMPPRRVWLELKKLACGGGSGGASSSSSSSSVARAWPEAVRLMYHLGLLRALFPWLRSDADARRAAVAAAALHNPRGRQEAVVAALPQELRVAGLVNPAAGAAGYEALALYYDAPREREGVALLARAAELAGAEGLAAGGAAAADDADNDADNDADSERRRAREWARIYAWEHGEAALRTLAAWMPADWSAAFLRRHEGRRAVAEADGAVARERAALARERARREADEAQADEVMMRAPRPRG